MARQIFAHNDDYHKITLGSGDTTVIQNQSRTKILFYISKDTDSAPLTEQGLVLDIDDIINVDSTWYAYVKNIVDLDIILEVV